MISGVAQVQVLGAQKYAVHVQMDRTPWLPANRHQRDPNRVDQLECKPATGAIIGPQRAFTLQASGS